MTPPDHAYDRALGGDPGRSRTARRQPRPVSERLAQRRRRVHRIRTWVVGTGIATFLAVWGALFSQIVGTHTAAVATTTTAQVASSTGSTGSSNSMSSSSSGGSSSSTGGSSSSAGTTSHVTSSQS